MVGFNHRHGPREKRNVESSKLGGRIIKKIGRSSAGWWKNDVF